MKQFMIYGTIAIVGFLLVVFAAIQFIPYGHDHTNPPVVSEPKWSTPQFRQALVDHHCFQCHSNETEWPWYTNIAPASWLVAFDVQQGRDKFNFSDWENSPTELEELINNVKDGEMPPAQYTMFHPDAVLSEKEKSDLIAGFEATFK